MLKSYQYWILSLIAALGLLLMVLDIVDVHRNQTLRTEVEGRAQYIQQSEQLQGLYQQMIKALADLSVRNKDDQLRDLLSKEGINITVNPPAQTPTGPAAKAR
jgi:hypothetical protein